MLQQTLGGSFKLFRLWGIQVYLHWWWFIAAWYFISRDKSYSHIGWNVAEYLTLFAIVLMHEFGHALACRSVGGKAEHIVLWPLGGVAFVEPPQRPGAVLWSIVAGPLVNAVLFPVTTGIALAAQMMDAGQDLQHYLEVVWYINVALFVFNMLPIYPLDGGQILQSILWFFIGRAKSLAVATTIGLIAAVAGGAYALYTQNMWLVLIAAFAAWQSFHGYRISKILATQEDEERAFEQRLRDDLNRPGL